MPKPKKTSLTQREELFCQEFVVDEKAGAAARRAGYKDRSADATASALRRRSDIQFRIEELRAERIERIHVTQDMVIYKLWQIADLDPKELFYDDGRPKALSEIEKSVRKAISFIKVHKLRNEKGEEIGEAVELKFADRMKALEMLGRHLGLFKDRIEHSTSLGLADRLQKALKKS